MADTTYKTTEHAMRDIKDTAREYASDVADNVSDAASRVQEKASAYTRKAADQFNAATDYFRDHEMKEIAEDAKAWVREHPTQAIIGAAALGFLTAALLRRR